MISLYCKCGKFRRSNQRNCHVCHARSTREWRKRVIYTPEQKKRINARHYALVYFSRGKIEKKNCLICNSKNSQMHHPDYSKPLDVIWLCRHHHLELHKQEKATKKAIDKGQPI